MAPIRAQQPKLPLAHSIHHEADSTLRDASAKEDVVRRYAPLVKATAARRTSDPVYRKDLEQIGYLALLVALERFDSTKRVPFAAFARKMVHYFVNDELRTRTKYQKRNVRYSFSDETPSAAENLLFTESDEAAVCTEDHCESHIALDSALDAFVRSLPPDTATIVKRIFWDGATEEQVAQELGVSRRTVASRRSAMKVQGQERLRSAWEATRAA